MNLGRGFRSPLLIRHHRWLAHQIRSTCSHKQCFHNFQFPGKEKKRLDEIPNKTPNVPAAVAPASWSPYLAMPRVADAQGRRKKLLRDTVLVSEKSNSYAKLQLLLPHFKIILNVSILILCIKR